VSFCNGLLPEVIMLYLVHIWMMSPSLAASSAVFHSMVVAVAALHRVGCELTKLTKLLYHTITDQYPVILLYLLHRIISLLSTTKGMRCKVWVICKQNSLSNRKHSKIGKKHWKCLIDL